MATKFPVHKEYSSSKEGILSVAHSPIIEKFDNVLQKRELIIIFYGSGYMRNTKQEL